MLTYFTNFQANHTVMHWAIESFRSKFPEKIPHVVTTNIEHCATELPLKAWRKEGKIKVTFVPVENGIVEKDQIRNAVQDSTCLVTVMMANNETGVIQPIKEIVQMVKSINESRKKNNHLIYISKKKGMKMKNRCKEAINFMKMNQHQEKKIYQ